jgi:hypothetical protein
MAYCILFVSVFYLFQSNKCRLNMLFFNLVSYFRVRVYHLILVLKIIVLDDCNSIFFLYRIIQIVLTPIAKTKMMLAFQIQKCMYLYLNCMCFCGTKIIFLNFQMINEIVYDIPSGTSRLFLACCGTLC